MAETSQPVKPTRKVHPQDVYQTIVEGRMVSAALGFAFFSGLVVASAYDLIKEPPFRLEKLQILLVFVLALATVVVLFLWARGRVIQVAKQDINKDVRAILCVAKYYPEAVASLEFKNRRAEFIGLVFADPAADRNESKADMERTASHAETIRRQSPRNVQVQTRVVANRNQSDGYVQAVFELLMECRKARIKPDDIVLDLTDVPTHVLVDLLDVFNGRVWCFQTVPKSRRDEVDGSHPDYGTSRQFNAGLPFRFRALAMTVERAPDGDPGA